MRSSSTSLAALAAGLWLTCAACGSSSNPPGDGATDSASSADSAAASDSATAMDSASEDSSTAPDASAATDSAAVPDGASADSGDAARADSAAADAASGADASDASSCNYNPVNEVLVDCSGSYRFTSYFVADPESAACPPFWQVGTAAPAMSYEQAAMNGGCSTACVWRFAMSVSRLRCGVRTGYETLTGTPESCPTLYRFSEGFFTSVEAHDAMYPCSGG